MANKRSRIATPVALLAIAGLLATVAQVAQADASSPDWPQYLGGPGHTGSNPFETTISRSNVDALTLRWGHSWPLTTASGRRISNLAPPVIAGGVVYETNGLRGVFAFDARTGHRLWHVSAGHPLDGKPSLAVGDGLLYVGGERWVQALDVSTGAIKWTYVAAAAQDKLDGPILFDNGVVSFFGNFGWLHTLDATTGAPLWTVDLQTMVPPVSADGVMYISLASEVDAVDATTGNILWSYEDPAAARMSVYAVAGGIAYGSVFNFGSTTSSFQALDASDGTVLWSFNPGLGTGAFGPPTILDGRVIAPWLCANCGTDDGHLFSFDATTGQLGWTTPGFAGCVTSANGLLYVTFLSAQGPSLQLEDVTTGASLRTIGRADSCPAVVNGLAYFIAYPTDVSGNTTSHDLDVWGL